MALADTEGRRLLRAWLDADSERTQVMIAKRIGISPPAISQWLDGTSRPESHNRQALNMLTGIPESAWLTNAEREQLEGVVERIAAAATGTEGR